jgi:hypothetical protein
MTNPWLQIPLRDSEGHMAHATVAQARMLSAVLREAVAELQPRSLAILGAAGGNGLEAVDAASVRRVVATDRNPEYLTACTERRAHRFTHYEAVLHDLSTGPPPFAPVDLVFAGLLLEYLDGYILFDLLPPLLSARGVFVTLLQLHSARLSTVSRLPFTGMSRLGPVFHVVDPAKLRPEAAWRMKPAAMTRKRDYETDRRKHLERVLRQTRAIHPFAGGGPGDGGRPIAGRLPEMSKPARGAPGSREGARLAFSRRPQRHH